MGCGMEMDVAAQPLPTRDPGRPDFTKNSSACPLSQTIHSQMGAVIYTPPHVCVHSTRTVRSLSQSMQTPHTLHTLYKNCTMEESNHSGTNSRCWTHTLPLCHCGLLYSDNLCYMCNLWPHWEMCLLLFNMGHMIYVLDQFFSVNSMVMSVL
jgi:hypothetical protein